MPYNLHTAHALPSSQTHLWHLDTCQRVALVLYVFVFYPKLSIWRLHCSLKLLAEGEAHQSFWIFLMRQSGSLMMTQLLLHAFWQCWLTDWLQAHQQLPYHRVSLVHRPEDFHQVRPSGPCKPLTCFIEANSTCFPCFERSAKHKHRDGLMPGVLIAALRITRAHHRW